MFLTSHFQIEQVFGGTLETNMKTNMETNMETNVENNPEILFKQRIYGLRKRRGRLRLRIQKPDCEDGIPCGYACIEKIDDCGETQTPDGKKKNWSWVASRVRSYIKKFVEWKKTDPEAASGGKVFDAAADIFAQAQETYDKVYETARRRKGVSKEEAKIEAEFFRNVYLERQTQKLSTSQDPDTIDKILNAPFLTVEGKEMNMLQYRDYLKEKREKMKADGSYEDGSLNIFNERKPPTSDEFYKHEKSKRRKVSDKEVDAVWYELGKNPDGEALRDRVFKADLGSPERRFEDCLKTFKDDPEKRARCKSTIQRDWGGDTLRLQKTMLKAFLEQTEFRNGKMYLFDPNDPTDNGREFRMLDLDHIVPISKGGKHGVGLKESARRELYPSGNFVWTNKYFNRNYKGANDLIDSIDNMENIRNSLIKGVDLETGLGVSKYEQVNMVNNIKKSSSAYKARDIIKGIKEQNKYPKPDELDELNENALNKLAKTLMETGKWSPEVYEAFKGLDMPTIGNEEFKRQLLGRYFGKENKKDIKAVNYLMNTAKLMYSNLMLPKIDAKAEAASKAKFVLEKLIERAREGGDVDPEVLKKKIEERRKQWSLYKKYKDLEKRYGAKKGGEYEGK